jgi:hypothetical protein
MRGALCSSRLKRWLNGCPSLPFWHGQGQLQAGATAWINAKLVSENSFRERERPEYVMAHSLAHALMTKVAIDCGYPASALKERL